MNAYCMIVDMYLYGLEIYRWIRNNRLKCVGVGLDMCSFYEEKHVQHKR